jgi:hypothetical protein
MMPACVASRAASIGSAAPARAMATRGVGAAWAWRSNSGGQTTVFVLRKLFVFAIARLFPLLRMVEGICACTSLLHVFSPQNPPQFPEAGNVV